MVVVDPEVVVVVEVKVGIVVIRIVVKNSCKVVMIVFFLSYNPGVLPLLSVLLPSLSGLLMINFVISWSGCQLFKCWCILFLWVKML